MPARCHPGRAEMRAGPDPRGEMQPRHAARHPVSAAPAIGLAYRAGREEPWRLVVIARLIDMAGARAAAGCADPARPLEVHRPGSSPRPSDPSWLPMAHGIDPPDFRTSWPAFPVASADRCHARSGDAVRDAVTAGSVGQVRSGDAVDRISGAIVDTFENPSGADAHRVIPFVSGDGERGGDVGRSA